MREYSDYVNAVYGYLKNYNKFKAQVKILAIKIKDKEQEIETFGGAKIANYNITGGSSGGSVSNEVEQRAFLKMKLQDELNQLQNNKSHLQRRMELIDEAIQSLNETEQKIVRLKFIDGYRWMYVSCECGYSERQCQNIGKKSVQKLADVIFNFVPTQMGLNFIFIENKQDKEYHTDGL